MIFLQYGVNSSGELVHIDQAIRGKTELACPYCGGQLLARKGDKVAYHFAHAGETCRQADRDPDEVALPAYDRFDLHLSGKMLDALHRFETDTASERDLTLLKREDLIQWNDRAGRWGAHELTKRGKIPSGKLSLDLFNQYQAERIEERHEDLEEKARKARSTIDLDTFLTDLRIYRRQWSRLLACTLYFLEVQSAAGVYHKIGVTTRSVEERIEEVRADLTPLLGPVKIKVLDTWSHRGGVELYFKHRYRVHQAPIGTLTEYFQFPKIGDVTRDLRRMKPAVLSELESGILDGLSSDLELELEDERQAAELEQIEHRRRASIRASMARLRERGELVGRPSEDVTRQPYFEAVRAALDAGLSLRKAADRAGVAVNTVRKVQAVLGVGNGPRNGNKSQETDA